MNFSVPIHSTKYVEENKKYEGENLLNLLLDTTSYNCVVWLLLINHDFLKRIGLKFYPGIIHEDELWMFLLCRFLSKFAFVHKSTYVHYRTANSIMSNVFKDNTLSNASWAVILGEIAKSRLTTVQCYFYSLECK